jgi:hypothetical protein
LPLEGDTVWTIKPPSVNKEGGFFVCKSGAQKKPLLIFQERF